MRDLYDPMRFSGIEDELCLGIFALVSGTEFGIY
jgi:hypothetical protein